MRYIECPAEYNGKDLSLFLGGGISNCPDWQSELVEKLKDTDLVLINPRRKIFPIDDSNASTKQIEWEYPHLEKSKGVCFWFPAETLCPITLFELGKQSVIGKPLFVGVHPDYQRKLDVEVQMKLQRPGLSVVYSLDDLAKQVSLWANRTKGLKPGVLGE